MQANDHASMARESFFVGEAHDLGLRQRLGVRVRLDAKAITRHAHALESISHFARARTRELPIRAERRRASEWNSIRVAFDGKTIFAGQWNEWIEHFRQRLEHLGSDDRLPRGERHARVERKLETRIGHLDGHLTGEILLADRLIDDLLCFAQGALWGSADAGHESLEAARLNLGGRDEKHEEDEQVRHQVGVAREPAFVARAKMVPPWSHDKASMERRLPRSSSRSASTLRSRRSMKSRRSFMI